MMDNLTPHKVPGVREAIESAGAELRYLPRRTARTSTRSRTCGASKVKGRLRSLAARTVDSLHDAIGAALATVTPKDCVGFFRHCGYIASSNGAQL